MSDRTSTPGTAPGKGAASAAGAAADTAARLGRRHSARISAAVMGITGGQSDPLSDRQQTIVRNMVDDVTGRLEDDLRARLLADPDFPEKAEMRAALGADHVAIAGPLLDRAGLAVDRELVALAVERSDAHDLARKLRRDEGPSNAALDALIGDSDRELAAAAMAMVIAESRGNERLGEPRLHESDLPAELRARLIWQIAAALRYYGVTAHDLPADRLDAAISKAAWGLVEATADTVGIVDAALDLVERLAQSTQSAEPLIADAWASGRVTLYAAMLARLVDLDFSAALQLLGDPQGHGHALALRAGGIDRDTGGALVMAALDGSSADWLAAWDDMSAEDAEAALEPWRLDPGYRAALAQFAATDRRG